MISVPGSDDPMLKISWNCVAEERSVVLAQTVRVEGEVNVNDSKDPSLSVLAANEYNKVEIMHKTIFTCYGNESFIILQFIII